MDFKGYLLVFLLINKLREEIDNLKSEIEIIKNRLTPTDSKVENNKTYVYGDSGSTNYKSGDLGKIDAELTLGNYLKSSRLGYRWSSEHKAFIRMSLIKDKIYVSVAPSKQLPSRIIKKYDKYICWWESNDINEILNDCKPLKNIYNPQIRQDFITDYDGFYLRDFDISKKISEAE